MPNKTRWEVYYLPDEHTKELETLIVESEFKITAQEQAEWELDQMKLSTAIIKRIKKLK